MIEIWYIEEVNGLIKFLATLPGIDLKENLNINIPTTDIISNLDIFMFYKKKNFRKFTK